jgi:hypothetical protein
MFSTVRVTKQREVGKWEKTVDRKWVRALVKWLQLKDVLLVITYISMAPFKIVFHEWVNWLSLFQVVANFNLIAL